MLFGLEAGLARGVAALSRATGRGGGTTLPGRLLLRVQPDAIRTLAGRLERGSVVVSATNGKTTTAKMAATNAPEADQYIRREYRKGWEL